MTAIISFGIVLNIWCFIILIRNQKVYWFRRKIFQAILDVARTELAVTYLMELERVKYKDMVWEFWKPLRSYYSADLLKLLE